MTKTETRYACVNPDEDITIVESSESYQVRVIFPIPERWRSKASAVKFYQWVAEQIKLLPKEKS